MYRYIIEFNQIKMFKKRKNITDLELVLSTINQLEKYKKIIIDKKNIIVIIPNGIFFIKVLDYTSYISGDVKENYLIKKENSKKITINNDLKNYDLEYQNIKKNCNEKITKYIVIKNNCILDLKINSDIKIVKFRELYYKLSSGDNKYSEVEINDIYEKLYCQIMSKN